MVDPRVMLGRPYDPTENFFKPEKVRSLGGSNHAPNSASAKKPMGRPYDKARTNHGRGQSPRHAPARNPKTQKRAKRIKARSPKRVKEDREYAKLRKQFLVEHPKCEIEWDDKCGKKANQVHHVKRRGKNYLKVETWKSSCRHCHEMVEHNGSEAEARGFLVREYSENKS